MKTLSVHQRFQNFKLVRQMLKDHAAAIKAGTVTPPATLKELHELFEAACADDAKTSSSSYTPMNYDVFLSLLADFELREAADAMVTRKKYTRSTGRAEALADLQAQYAELRAAHDLLVERVNNLLGQLGADE